MKENSLPQFNLTKSKFVAEGQQISEIQNNPRQDKMKRRVQNVSKLWEKKFVAATIGDYLVNPE